MNTDEDDEYSSHVSKDCRDCQSGARMIAFALQQLATITENVVTATNYALSKPERAVGKLLKEYTGVLSDRDIMKAVGLFETEMKAGMFLVMKKGEFQDMWLQDQLDRLKQQGKAKR
ncbi:hypothetical protein NEOLI_002918 [Neolecta irregularis DAH-3]|uniref:Uncharacterized protein n=1 Tax=Neolecta irregularis (strain DAH-3) TaxID=1198029 RepID=A0A1U7LNI9_NEOID|nr:hypothetical protein NEOLI_002918 [Neolecta irregularis DAH-3]|eukprot:OLL24091.1 hypothetical protein NEOLI_002918 [Neolecta irregularis DAH-3]